MNNLDVFLKEYKIQLIKAREEQPEVYAWPIQELPAVFARMSDAIVKGSFSKDSVSLKRTCNALGIKHTYKAISEYIKGV